MPARAGPRRPEPSVVSRRMRESGILDVVILYGGPMPSLIHRILTDSHFWIPAIVLVLGFLLLMLLH